MKYTLAVGVVVFGLIMAVYTLADRTEVTVPTVSVPSSTVSPHPPVDLPYVPVVPEGSREDEPLVYE